MRAALVLTFLIVACVGCAPGAPRAVVSPTPPPADGVATANSAVGSLPALIETTSAAPLEDGPAGCAADEQPTFAYGFATLKQLLGPRMGEPTSCERFNTDTGDSLQQTTRGMARYTRTTNTPSFTSGAEHWALTADGLVYWVGRDAEPPEDAQVVLAKHIDAPLPDATPVPGARTPTPPPTAGHVRREGLDWLEPALNLIDDYDRRHGTILGKAIESSNVVVTDAPGLWAAFVPKAHTLVLTPQLKHETPEAVATVLAHEGLHAVDTAKYGGPRDDVACYTYETSAFRLQAAVWQSFYGDAGKPAPGTELERELNKLLELARTDAWTFINDIRARYQDECS